jgi:hypothetical protein
MFKQLLATSSGDINWMALFALVTFFLIFSIVLFQIIFQKKKYSDYMSQLPLGDGDDSININNKKN